MTECDISDTIVAKSDQLNADDLLSGAITVTITDVKRCDDEVSVDRRRVAAGDRRGGMSLPCDELRAGLRAWLERPAGTNGL